jgi:hypothetical protein
VAASHLGRDSTSSWQRRMPYWAIEGGLVAAQRCPCPKMGSSWRQQLLWSINTGGPWTVAPSRWARREVCDDMDESLAHLHSVPAMMEHVGFVPLLGGVDKGVSVC